VTDRYVSSPLKLAFLPPRLVDACLAGETRELSAMSLDGADGVPMLWKAAHSRN
jgi:hypothetical protein